MTIERQGFEYIRFHRQDVLVPASNGEPIRVGTGMTQSHLDIAIQLQRARDKFSPEVFAKFLRRRERELRRSAGLLGASYLGEEAAKRRIGYLGVAF